MLTRSHPKLVARGSEVEEADLKFKGAPADDCDPFAIQNYIDRLAADVYDATQGTKLHANKEDKDEWELMKEKAKSVPFQDVALSIALKHGLLDEVKKENSNKPFEKESILTIMKVRDEFLHDYSDASNFEYQWQIWVEWERYLKQIGITIPQWGKIARKLIRLGVARIQEDMTKKYNQISSGANKRKPTDASDHVLLQERRRRVTHPIDGSAASMAPPTFGGGVGFNNFINTTIHRSSSFTGIGDVMHTFSSGTVPYSSSSPSSSSASSPRGPNSPPFSPMHSPMSNSPTFHPTFPFGSQPQGSTFGASLYNMISPHGPPPTNLFGASSSSSSTPMRSPSMSSASSPAILFDNPYNTMDNSPSTFTNNYASLANPSASLPYPYDIGFVTASSTMSTLHHGSTPSYAPLIIPSTSAPSYHPLSVHYPSHSSFPYSSLPHLSTLSSPATTPNSSTPSSMATSPAYSPVSLPSPPSSSSSSSSSVTLQNFSEDGTPIYTNLH